MTDDAFDQPLQAEQLFDPVAWWGRVDGTRTALIEASTGRRHSYATLNADAELWATRLHALGVAHGSRVAVFAQNRPEFIALLFACHFFIIRRACWYDLTRIFLCTCASKPGNNVLVFLLGGQ